MWILVVIAFNFQGGVDVAVINKYSSLDRCERAAEIFSAATYNYDRNNAPRGLVGYSVARCTRGV